MTHQRSSSIQKPTTISIQPTKTPPYKHTIRKTTQTKQNILHNPFPYNKQTATRQVSPVPAIISRPIEPGSL